MIYLAFFVLLSVTALFEVHMPITKRTKELYIMLICFSWLILSSIRWQRGTDWNAYYTFYMGDNPLVKDWRGFEIGYRLLNYLVKVISNSNYTAFLFICALIIFVFQYKSIMDMNYNYSSERSIAVLSYPSLFMIGLLSTNIGNIFVTRSVIAYIILLFSLRYIVNKDLLKFIICVIAASLFHRTSMIFIFAYFIYYFDFLKHLVHISIASIPLILMAFPIVLREGAALLGEAFETRVNLYLENSNSVSISGLLNATFLLVVFYIAYLVKFEKDLYYKGMLKLYYVGFLLYVAGYRFGNVFLRLAGQYNIVQILLLYKLLELGKNKKEKTIICIFILLYYALRFYSTLHNYWSLFYPFKTIFNMGLEVYYD